MTRTYSPKDVSVVVDGFKIDTFQSVTVDFAEDRISHNAAATGESTRVINANNLGTITLVLPQTSVKNSELMDVYNSILAEYAAGKFAPVKIKDKLGNSAHAIMQASIKKVPASPYEKDSADRTWVIEGDLTEHEVRGNN